MSELTPYEEKLAIELGKARARIEELEAKLEKTSEVQKAQQLFNYYAVEVCTYGATAARLQNLESAWVNLQTQAELAELKGEDWG
jgi:flagellar biosynthesis chaperone FliJ